MARLRSWASSMYFIHSRRIASTRHDCATRSAPSLRPSRGRGWLLMLWAIGSACSSATPSGSPIGPMSAAGVVSSAAVGGAGDSSFAGADVPRAGVAGRDLTPAETARGAADSGASGARAAGGYTGASAAGGASGYSGAAGIAGVAASDAGICTASGAFCPTVGAACSLGGQCCICVYEGDCGQRWLCASNELEGCPSAPAAIGESCTRAGGHCQYCDAEHVTMLLCQDGRFMPDPPPICI
jgi:hypothetical protein